jgi:hypothetical protein
MALPYESATSGERALSEIQRILAAFGCTKFGNMVDTEAGEVMVQFEYRGRPVSVRASFRGYAQAYLKQHPYSARMRCTRVEHERKALDIGRVAVYSVLRDWVKASTVMIEANVLSFEAAFLGQIMLPSGRTVFEHASETNLLQLGGPVT